jgi:hypothetical protein
MSWSVGNGLPPESDLIDEILLAAGKALYLANCFESKCQGVLRAAHVTDIIEADPVISLEQIGAKLPKPKMLDGTLQDLSPHMSQAELTVLQKARLARNYIAHEGAAAIGPLSSRNVRAMLNALRGLRAAVIDLAGDDNIVSEWIYFFEEPREAMAGLGDDYLDRIDRWVFGHLPREWLDDGWEPDHHYPETLIEIISYEPWYSRPHR